MTAGPANRMVTPLPRNKPTPIAPPMAIIVSCLWLSRRCKPSVSLGGGVFVGRAMTVSMRGRSVMASTTGGGNGQKGQVLLKNFNDCVPVVEGVIDVKRYPQAVETIGRNDAALCQRLYQLR